MLASTRESDDPVLPQSKYLCMAHVHIRPGTTHSCKQDGEVHFISNTQPHSYCSAKKGNCRYQTPKCSFIRLGIQKGYFILNFKLLLNTKPCC